jgi:hypothetical protein
MSVRYPDFEGELVLIAKIHAANPNLNAELTAISTALASDATTHDRTIQTPPAALLSGAGQTRFANDVLNLVNIAKAGNLPTATIIAGIDAVAAVAAPPGVVDVPLVYGTAAVGGTLNCTSGNWVGTPSSYTYAWKRDGATAIGTNSNVYTVAAADSGHSIACRVSATNATGTTAAPLSNGIAIP